MFLIGRRGRLRVETVRQNDDALRPARDAIEKPRPHPVADTEDETRAVENILTGASGAGAPRILRIVVAPERYRCLGEPLGEAKENLDAVMHVDVARRRFHQIRRAAFGEAEIAPPPPGVPWRHRAKHFGIARIRDRHAQNLGPGAKARMARVSLGGERDGTEAVAREQLLARQHDCDPLDGFAHAMPLRWLTSLTQLTRTLPPAISISLIAHGSWAKRQ